MFLIPYSQRIDWRRPPLMTLLLIALNTTVYGLVQSKDAAYAQAAIEYYLRSPLPALEFPHYVQYLRDMGRPALSAGVDDQRQTDPVWVLNTMEDDAGFMAQLEQDQILTPDADDYAVWKAQRHAYERLAAGVLWREHGLKPAEPRLWNFLSALFLHANWEHLLANMIFLLMVGIAVETILGALRFLLVYFSTGVLASLAYIISHADSLTPSIGASGAIAGLMGTYTVLFGLRRIDFFYFVFVYFDTVKAPAIVLLPIWLGYELIQLTWSEAHNVNYIAHIGGLASGALLGLLAKRRKDKLNLNYLDAERRLDEYRRRYDGALRLLAALKYEQATHQLQQLALDYPGDVTVLRQLYAASKLSPAAKAYHTAVATILDLDPGDAKTRSWVAQVYDEYLRLAVPRARLPAGQTLQLANRFCQWGKLRAAEQTIGALLNNPHPPAAAPDALLKLANGFYKNAQPDKYRHYLRLIQTRFPGTPECLQAQQQLDRLA